MVRGLGAGALAVIWASASGGCAAPDSAQGAAESSGQAPAREKCGAPATDTPDHGCAIGETCSAGACEPNLPSCAKTGGCLPDQMYCDDAAHAHFVVTDEIVVDLQSQRRLWQRHAPADRMTYAAALEHCDGLNLSGFTGWRIPDIDELHSIVFKPGGLMACMPGYCCPAIDQSAFPATPADLFWSSSPSGPTPELVYCLQFADGRHTNWKTEPTDPQYIRCTHDPLP